MNLLARDFYNSIDYPGRIVSYLLRGCTAEQINQYYILASRCHNTSNLVTIWNVSEWCSVSLHQAGTLLSEFVECHVVMRYDTDDTLRNYYKVLFPLESLRVHEKSVPVKVEERPNCVHYGHSLIKCECPYYGTNPLYEHSPCVYRNPKLCYLAMSGGLENETECFLRDIGENPTPKLEKYDWEDVVEKWHEDGDFDDESMAYIHLLERQMERSFEDRV